MAIIHFSVDLEHVLKFLRLKFQKTIFSKQKVTVHGSWLSSNMQVKSNIFHDEKVNIFHDEKVNILNDFFTIAKYKIQCQDL